MVALLYVCTVVSNSLVSLKMGGGPPLCSWASVLSVCEQQLALESKLSSVLEF